MSNGDLHLGPRTIPIPNSISPEAQKALVMTGMRQPDHLPPLEDKEAWRKICKQAEEDFVPFYTAYRPKYDVSSEQSRIAGVNCYTATPNHPASGFSDKIYYDIHGGALVFLGGEACRVMGVATAANLGLRTISVDYRMAPDHPYPAALDDCVAVYAALVKQYGAANIVAGGASAGGNLAAATMLRARDEGIELPAGLVLLSPEVDLTESGDTFQTNDGIDVMERPRITAALRLYADGHDLAHPYLSPLLGDIAGFPPTFLQSGTRDMFLSNTVRMHRKLRKAGIEAELHIWEAMPHGAFFGVPEEEEVNAEMRRFVYERLK